MKPIGLKRGGIETYPPPKQEAERALEKRKSLAELAADLEAEQIPDAELEDDGECPCCFKDYEAWLEDRGLSVCDNCRSQVAATDGWIDCLNCGACR